MWWADYANSLVGCQVQPCMEAAGCCLAGSGHEMAGCGTLWGPRASSGSLVGGSRVLKTGTVVHPLGGETRPWVSAGLLAATFQGPGVLDLISNHW